MLGKIVGSLEKHQKKSKMNTYSTSKMIETGRC